MVCGTWWLGGRETADDWSFAGVEEEGINYGACGPRLVGSPP
jgi:hypothetical protein